MGLKSSWLKCPGLKLGVEKSGVEMSFNPEKYRTFLKKHLEMVFKSIQAAAYNCVHKILPIVFSRQNRFSNFV